MGTEKSPLEKANELLDNEIYLSLSSKFEEEVQNVNARRRCNDGIYEESYRDGGGNTRWRIIGWECPDYGSGIDANPGVPVYLGIIDYWNEPERIDAGSRGGGGTTPNSTGTPPDRTDIFEFGSEKETLEYLVENAQNPDAARKRLLEYLDRFGGIEGKEFVAMYNELWNTPSLDYADKLELNQMAYDYKQQLVAQYFMGIFSPENVGIIIGFAITPGISNTLRTRVFNVLPRYLSKSTIG